MTYLINNNNTRTIFYRAIIIRKAICESSLGSPKRSYPRN